MNRREKGSEILEFSLILLPMMAMLTVLLDVGWLLFAKSTLQRAVRVGVTYGINATAAQISSGCLTDNVKSQVQQNSFGLLSGSSGLSSIKVNYFLPPPPNSAGPLTDVSTQTNGNSPGNIMQVSVPNVSLFLLTPRIVSWQQAADNSAVITSVSSAGMIEPSTNPACIGTAP